MPEIRSFHPRLVVEGGDAALDFYTAALGAEITERYTVDGRVVHAMLQVGPVRFAVKDADDADPAPGSDGPPVILTLEVDDADAVAERMLAAGARVVFPIADHDYGDRGGRLADPFGHHWMIAARRLDLTPDEIQARLDAVTR
ncbi:VOC family protein [Pseudonocardia hispaniensis]|uniref:VOC family protein n=1 Tax=Pseudonocardia hispaniensis TaxID=904933 RepID=A0ABW1IZ51_9PSEU